MDSSTRRRLRGASTAAAGLGLSFLLTGCGFDMQTLQPYTPAHGVNTEAGDVKIRNLLVVADAEGQGVLSTSLVSGSKDALTGVTGTSITEDGAVGAPLTVTSSPVELFPNQLVNLSDPATVFVTGPDLRPGQVVDLQLQFQSGNVARIKAPVMDSNLSVYQTITPVPAASSPSPDGTATATPAATATAAPSPTATPGATPAPSPTTTP